MTAELAVGLVAVMLVLLAVLTMVEAAVAQVRCVDGARAGARAAAMGVTDDEVRVLARRSAGEAATVQVRRSDGWVEVEVATGLPGAGLLRSLTVQAEASTPAEP